MIWDGFMINPPNLSKLWPNQREIYKEFIDETSEKEVEHYQKGGNLSKLVDLAEATIIVIHTANPFAMNAEIKTNKEHDQWELDSISDVKKRVAKALEQKKIYYDHTFMGKLSKLLLKITNQWKDGHPPAIKKAEDFLMSYEPILVQDRDFLMLGRQGGSVKKLTYTNTVDLTNFFRYIPD